MHTSVCGTLIVTDNCVDRIFYLSKLSNPFKISLSEVLIPIRNTQAIDRYFQQNRKLNEKTGHCNGRYQDLTGPDTSWVSYISKKYSHPCRLTYPHNNTYQSILPTLLHLNHRIIIFTQAQHRYFNSSCPPRNRSEPHKNVKPIWAPVNFDPQIAALPPIVH